MKIPIVPKPATGGVTPETAGPSAPGAAKPASPESEARADVDDTGAVDALDGVAGGTEGEAFARGRAQPIPDDAGTPLATRLEHIMNRGVGTSRARARTDAAGATFHAEHQFTSTPGHRGAPEVGEGHGPDPKLVRNGVKLGAGVVFDNDGEPERVSGSVSVAGGKVGLSADGAVGDGVGWDASVGLKRTYLTASGGLTLAEPGGEVNRYGWFLGADPSFNSLAVGGGVTTTDDGVTTDFFAMLSGSAVRDAKDLGAYGGERPELQGTRKIEVQRKVGGALLGLLGALDLIGVGARLVPSKSKEVIYRTHVNDEDARRIVHEGEGFGQYARDKARAVGLSDDPVEVPELDDLEALKVGDEVIVHTEGGLSAGVAVGSGASKVGVYALMNGEFRLGVRRLDEDRVEMMVTPTKLRGFHAAAGAPFILDVSWAKTRARSLSQGFVFDVGTQSGRDAYRLALQGQLPNGFSEPRQVDARDAAGVRALLVDEELPAGVERSYLEAVDVSERKAGGGLNFGLLHTYWGVGGLSRHTHRVDEDRTITDGTLAVSTSTRGIEKRREVLLSGRESLGVSAAVRRISTFDDDGTMRTALDNIRLVAHFADDRVRGFELNDKVVDQVNDVFGTDIAHFRRKGRNQTRELRVTRELTPADFNRLASLREDEIRDIAERAGARVSKLQDLVGRLQLHPSELERSVAIQSFVQDQGLVGMGMLHRALGAKKRSLGLATTSNAYTKPVERARDFTFKYATPVEGGEEKSSLTKRFKAAFDILADVAEGLEDALDDPLLDDATRSRWTAELETSGRQVGDTIAVHHLDDEARDRLKKTLNRGWTSAVQKRIMDMLSPVTQKFPDVELP